MDTEHSPQNFRKILLGKLLELLWRQWRALGVASFGRETDYLLDLEALIMATAAAGNHDRRLLAGAVQWLRCSREWVNLARLKRMASAFIGPDVFLKQSLVNEQSWKCLSNALRQAASPGRAAQNADTLRTGSVTTPPLLKKASLRQLYLRSIFGINARAEILLYLLLEKEGNSNQIAREVGCDQKSVYRILERWAEAGFINRKSGTNQNLYSLEPGNVFFRNLIIPHSFWRWGPFYRLFARLLAAASTAPWSRDAYLLSSLFRDIHPDALMISRSAGIALPDSGLYPGEDLFVPMARALESLLDYFLR